jgi:hypothetical protein
VKTQLLQTQSTAAAPESAVLIRPYTDEWREAVAAFNQRVKPANAPFQLPETSAADWIPKSGARKPYQEMFLAVQDRSVRGSYTFKNQDFVLGGQIREVGMCRMPISEGIVDCRYAMIGVSLVKDAVKRQPLLYALGIGSLDAVVTRLVLAMGWKVIQTVPFYFKVNNGFRFLRNARHLRSTRLRRVLLDAAAYSGAGSAGARFADVLLTRNGHREVYAKLVSDFDDWADRIWQASEARYSMIAVRDAAVLSRLYPLEEGRFMRLRIQEGGDVIGWAVLLDTAMHENKYFGNMRVGTIVDCLAAPEDATKVMAAASRFLEQRGVDVLVSNQSHPAWCRGLKIAGFLCGPSNFFFVASRQLSKVLGEIDPQGAAIHLNRGDGDGPIHL